MASFHTETVVDIHHWNNTLFSFKTTRDPSFRFDSGQFVMLGIEIAGRPLLRAYSIASATYENHLEFFSIKVEDGPLTSVLKDMRPGDPLLVGRKPTGTLLLDNLRGGRNLYLVATGTGLAPFLSIIREADAYQRFDKVIVAHGCRYRDELAYADFIKSDLRQHELVGEQVCEQLLYYPAATRDPKNARPRLTSLLQSGELTGQLGLPPINPESDRFMLCGSTAMLQDLRAMLNEWSFAEGNSGTPGDYVYEKAFVG